MDDYSSSQNSNISQSSVIAVEPHEAPDTNMMGILPDHTHIEAHRDYNIIHLPGDINIVKSSGGTTTEIFQDGTIISRSPDQTVSIWLPEDDCEIVTNNGKTAVMLIKNKFYLAGLWYGNVNGARIIVWDDKSQDNVPPPLQLE